MLRWITALQRSSKNSNGTATSLKSGSMSSCINPLGKTAHQRPARLGENSTKNVGHPKTVRGRPARAYHGNSLLQREHRKESPAPLPLNRQWRALQPLKAGGPIRVAGQQNMTRDFGAGLEAKTLAIAPDGAEHRGGPSELLLQPGERPAPDLLKAVRGFSRSGTELADPNGTDPRALQPQPQPGALRHTITISTKILSMSGPGSLGEGLECLRHSLRRVTQNFPHWMHAHQHKLHSSFSHTDTALHETG